MHDHLDAIALATRPAPQPQTERQIHRAVAISMRNPLNEQTPRSIESIQESAGPAKVARIEIAKVAVHEYAGRTRYSTVRVRTPHVNFITGRAKTLRHHSRVVADAARLWWVFAGDEMANQRFDPYNFALGSHSRLLISIVIRRLSVYLVRRGAGGMRNHFVKIRLAGFLWG